MRERKKERYIEIDGQTERWMGQTKRPGGRTDRHIDNEETLRCRDGETERRRNREIERQTYRKTERRNDKETH